MLALSAGRGNCAVSFRAAIPRPRIFHSHSYHANAAQTRLAGSGRKRQPRREGRFRLRRSLRCLFSGAIKPAVSPWPSNHTAAPSPRTPARAPLSQLSLSHYLRDIIILRPLRSAREIPPHVGIICSSILPLGEASPPPLAPRSLRAAPPTASPPSAELVVQSEASLGYYMAFRRRAGAGGASKRRPRPLLINDIRGKLFVGRQWAGGD